MLARRTRIRPLRSESRLAAHLPLISVFVTSFVLPSCIRIPCPACYQELERTRQERAAEFARLARDFAQVGGVGGNFGKWQGKSPHASCHAQSNRASTTVLCMQTGTQANEPPVLQAGHISRHLHAVPSCADSLATYAISFASPLLPLMQVDALYGQRALEIWQV